MGFSDVNARLEPFGFPSFVSEISFPSSVDPSSCSKKNLKHLWSSFVLLKSQKVDVSFFEKETRFFLQHPICKRDAVAELLVYLLARSLGMTAPPLVCLNHPMPLFEMCQLILLWEIAGRQEEASKSLNDLTPFLPFSALWAQEIDYSEEEALGSIRLLKTRQYDEFAHPFVKAIFHSLGPIHSNQAPAQLSSGFEWSQKRAQRLDVSLGSFVMTTVGQKTSLGAVYTDSAEIRSFGPQGFPLSDSATFGIEKEEDGKSFSNWSSLACFPEIWVNTHAEVHENSFCLDCQYMGLKTSTPFAFCFYVRAELATIGEQRFFPGSLTSYKGVAQEVCFGLKLKISSQSAFQMELLPLAGKNCFWDCQFLLAFLVSQPLSKYRYKIDLL